MNNSVIRTPYGYILKLDIDDAKFIQTYIDDIKNVAHCLLVEGYTDRPNKALVSAVISMLYHLRVVLDSCTKDKFGIEEFMAMLANDIFE